MSVAILNEILEHKRGVIDKNRKMYDACRKHAKKHKDAGSFKRSISRAGQLNLIAEIKKASPSKGVIRKDFDLISIARVYEECQAAAISVLTEDKYFLGQPDYIRQVNEEIHVPLLTKDFILAEGQIFEARSNG